MKDDNYYFSGDEDDEESDDKSTTISILHADVYGGGGGSDDDEDYLQAGTQSSCHSQPLLRITSRNRRCWCCWRALGQTVKVQELRGVGVRHTHAGAGAVSRRQAAAEPILPPGLPR